MSFKDDIERYIGTVVEADASYWLTEGAKEIIDIATADVLEPVSSDIAVTTAGLATNGYRVLDVISGDGWGCKKIDYATLSTSLADPNSIHYALETSPVFFYNNGKLYISYEGDNQSGNIKGIAYPTVLYSAIEVTGLPKQLYSAMVLHSAIRGTANKRNGILIAASAFTTPTAPTAPDSASFTCVDATATAVTATAIGSLGTAPTYTKPTVSLSEVPNVLVISTAPPSTPTAPSFDFTELTGTSVDPSSFATLPTAPSYNSTLPDQPTFTISTTPPTPPTAPSFDFTELAGTFIDPSSFATLPTAPGYNSTLPDQPVFVIGATPPTPPTISTLDYTDATYSDIVSSSTVEVATKLANLSTALDTEEDVELAQAHIQDIQMEIQKFNAESNSLLGQLSKSAELEEDVNKLNAIKGLEKQISQDQLNLSKYNSDLNQYNIQIDEQYKQHQLNLQSYVRESQTQLYDALNSFNADNAEYQAEVTKRVKDIDASLAESLEQARISHDVEKTNSIENLREEIEEYSMALQKFSLDIQAYNAEVDEQYKEHQLNLQSYVRESQTQLQEALNSFNANNAEYQAEVTKRIKDIDTSLAESLEEARILHDVEKTNSIENLKEEVEEYSATLQKFSLDIQKYNTEVNEAVQEYQTNLKRWEGLRQTELQNFSLDIQSEVNEFQKELETYRVTAQSAFNQANITLQEELLEAQQSTNVDIQNKAKALEADIAEFNANVNRFMAEIQNYQTELGEYQSKVAKTQLELDGYDKQITAYTGIYEDQLQKHAYRSA